MHIPFNRPLVIGSEGENLARVLAGERFSGGGEFTRACSGELEEKLGCHRAILTSSGTDALEMCALLCDLEPGDEVIMPSYTFVSTASAFALRRARIVWCDIRADTKNIDETKIELLITDRTRAVVTVHYAGVGSEMDTIREICDRHGLVLVEDAAQAIECSYRGRPLGSLGDVAAFSFHESKNIQCGEGGALMVNNPDLVQRAEFVRDKGTNRTLFNRGIVDKYTWVELGSSFLMSELQAAFLLPQLRRSAEINARRVEHFNRYAEQLADVLPPDALPAVPDHCRHNGHMFYILLADEDERGRMIDDLKDQGIGSVFHYVPLHKAPYWDGAYDDLELPVTESVSQRLLRLPMFYELSTNEIDRVCKAVEGFKNW